MTSHSKPADAATSEAAEWFALFQAGSVSPAERERFEAWLNDPEHRRAYQRMQVLWQDMGDIPQPGKQGATPARTIGRRRWASALAIAACLVVALLVVVYPKTAPETFSQRYFTGVGERHDWRLDDGTRLSMNQRSEVLARFDGESRSLKLLRGEIYLDVAHDTSKPFIIDTGLVQVRVVGTAFNVRKDPDMTVEVAVDRGAVAVSGNAPEAPPEVSLQPGEKASVATSGIIEVSEFQPGHSSDWRSGRLSFDDELLSDVIEEANRYLDIPLVIESPELADLRFSGDFLIEDLPMLAVAIERSLSIEARPSPDGREIELISRE